MNLKERGFTVGDLLLVVIFIVVSILILNKVKNDNQAINYIDSNNLKISKIA
tara:strand:- start:380 stop:535 length:156 start_codon:yes stop_codon:yes gene_type:complete